MNKYAVQAPLFEQSDVLTKEQIREIIKENEKLKKENEALKVTTCYMRPHFEEFAMAFKMARREIKFILSTGKELSPLETLDIISEHVKEIFRTKGIRFNEVIYDNWVYDINKNKY